ncbi:MAG: GNAT family N-acyltransferase [Pseudomonadota bacterium]
MTPTLRNLPRLLDGHVVRLAETEADVLGAKRLRYDVFVREMGGDGALVDHVAGLEQDAFDPVCDHIVLVDTARSDRVLSHVVGAYRVLPQERAHQRGYYCAAEYDLTPLLKSGRPILELGRSCLHPERRGGAGLYHLWTGLADYIAERGVEILFGVASFHGTDIAALAQPLSYLHHRHLAPPELRVRARPPEGVGMDRLPPEALDRRAAAKALPSLLKSYLRMGGYVGEGAWIDRPFNTTDVCIVLDVSRVDARTRALYGGLSS